MTLWTSVRAGRFEAISVATCGSGASFSLGESAARYLVVRRCTMDRASASVLGRSKNSCNANVGGTNLPSLSSVAHWRAGVGMWLQ